MKSVDRIITAKDYGGGARAYIRKTQAGLLRKGVTVAIKFKDPTSGEPVKARIWQGQWIADCEHCRGAAFVDPDEPVFFCFGCGNRVNNGRLRPVEFPAEREEIERLVLERPVDDVAGLTDMERAGLARPLVYVEKDGQARPLTRSWEPGETVEALRKQQAAALRAWRKAGAHGVQ